MADRRAPAHSDLSGKVDWGASVSLDSERQFLGLLLARGDVFDLVGTDLRGAQFYEPLHRKIFDLITSNRAKGLSFDRERLDQLLAIDPAFRAAGGRKYLDQVMQAATIAEVEGVAPVDLARTVADLHIRREVIKACSDILSGARSDGMQSGRELRDMLEGRLMAADYVTSQDQLRTIAQIIDGAIANSKKGGADLISTGFRKLDDRLTKCERSDLILIGARPSMGKSALASCIALCAAIDGIGVIEINGEMSEGQIARRHLADQCHRMYGERGPSYRDIRGGRLDGNQRAMLEAAAKAVEGLPLLAMRKRGMTLAQLKSVARRQAQAWRDQGTRLGFLIVDHVGILSTGASVYQRPIEAMTEISRTLKDIAIELDCVVLALSQLNRDLERREDKRPTLPDLRESGSLEQDADVVIGVYRDAYYAEREQKPKKREDQSEWTMRRGSTELEAICLKVKEGAPGTEKLFADVARNAIRDEDPAWSDAGQLDFSKPSTTQKQPIEEVPI